MIRKMENNLEKDEDFCYYSGLPSPMAYQKDKSKITKKMQNITNSEISIYQNILNEQAFEKLKLLVEERHELGEWASPTWIHFIIREIAYEL